MITPNAILLLGALLALALVIGVPVVLLALLLGRGRSRRSRIAWLEAENERLRHEIAAFKVPPGAP